MVLITFVLVAGWGVHSLASLLAPYCWASRTLRQSIITHVCALSSATVLFENDIDTADFLMDSRKLKLLVRGSESVLYLFIIVFILGGLYYSI